MTPKDWLLADEILQSALERPAEDWPALLDRACVERPDLRAEIGALLRADRRAADFLDQPVLGGVTPSDEPWVPGGRVGPYRLIEEIGFGGWSRVYLAERDDEQFRRRVAVKVVDPGPSGDEVAARFRVERQILAGLDHPSIARLLDGGETADGRLYFVLDHVDGLPIDRFAAGRGLDIEARLRLMIRVCDAVAYAHEHLIVHRDLKPGNLLVTADGAPKLLDFGIAKVLEPATFPQTVEATRTGLRPMTPAYAAPEQIRGEPISTATDVYALGLLLYELLTGRRAYELRGLNPAEIERVICDREPPRPSQAVARGRHVGAADAARASARRPPDATPTRLAGDLDDIVAAAMAKDPRRRYRTARHLAEDLRRHLDGEPITARTVTWWYQAERFVRRHRLAVGATLGVFALLLGLVVTLWFQSYELDAQRIRAENERAVAESERAVAEAVTDYLVVTFADADPERTRGRDVSARDMIDTGLARLDEIDDRAVRSRLGSALAEVYVGLGAVPEAIPLFEAARAEAVEMHGERSLEVAAIDHQLGAALLLDDEFELADPAILRAHAIRLAAYGPRHRDTALSLALLGHSKGTQGFYDEALEKLSAALDVLRPLTEDADLDVLEIEKNLAVYYFLNGRDEDAETHLAGLLDVARASPDGESRPITLEIQAAYAGVMSRRDVEAARSLMDEALDDQQRVLGPNHPLVADTLQQWARLHVADEPERALTAVEDALAINQRVWGAETWIVSINQATIALFLKRLGRHEEAEPYFRLAAENADRKTPSTHRWLTRTKMIFARHLIERGRYAEAEPLLREAARLHRNLPARNALYDGLAEGLIGLTALADGRVDKARELLEAHGAKVLEIFGPDSPEGERVTAAMERLGVDPAGSVAVVEPDAAP